MSMYANDQTGELKFGNIFVHLGLAVAAVVLLALGGCPQYSVYQQRLEGEAELAKANYSKQVAVQEANAKMEGAKLLAQAEVERAKGVAQANKIIGDSLKGNEDYLRYLWITDVAGSDKSKTVVYIPTEANMPILEAGKRPSDAP